MGWRIEGNGQAMIYQDINGSVRLRLAGDKFPLPNLPENGTVWALQALQGSAWQELFDLTYAHVLATAVGDTWLCTAEGGPYSFPPAIVAAWAAWKDAHPDLAWTDMRVQVNV